jgi:nicotinamide-nucleotide amidase
MDACIITVGKEVLTGKTTNLNLVNLGRFCTSLGINVKESFVIDDIVTDYENALKNVSSELIIFTGGLGPTIDDLTKEAVYGFFDVETVVSEEIVSFIESFFKRIGKTMKPANMKQAVTSLKGTILDNPLGTAPGDFFEANGHLIAILPGPPRENIAMLDQLKNILTAYLPKKIFSDGFQLTGIGESSMESLLPNIYNEFPDVTIAPYASIGMIKYVFSSFDEKRIHAAMNRFKSVFNQYIFGSLETSLEETVVNLLKENKFVISTAESCTGGLLASALTSIPGSSEVINESFVTYSNEAKIKHLNVKSSTLIEHGAVSETCALEMVTGLYNQTNADICVSITGIAGPSGGTREKPVGTVYFGIKYNEKISVHHQIFNGDREAVRRYSVIFALNAVRQLLVE